MAETGDCIRKPIGEVLAKKLKQWIFLGGVWGTLLALSVPIYAAGGAFGIDAGPARNRPPRISNKYSEFKRLAKFFFYHDGVLNSQEKTILEQLQKRLRIKPKEASDMIRDVATNLGFYTDK